MSSPDWFFRGVLTAPFTVSRSIQDMGSALWLYLWLVLRANRLGVVCRTLGSLGADLRSDDACVIGWLHQLEAVSLIAIEHPVPYLVIKLRMWPNSDSNSRDLQAAMPRAQAPSKQQLPEQQPKAAPAAGVDGGAGEGEGLLRDVERILGPGHEAELPEVLSHHEAALVREALQRVAKTPPAHIRKSRYALFRYLLIRYSHASHDGHTPYHAAV